MTSSSTTTFWQNAYKIHAPKLLGLCQRCVADKNKAQDLLHDAFVTAIGKQTTFMNKGSFEGWLRRITINTVLMHLRKEKHFFQNIDDLEIGASTEDDERNMEDTKSLILNSNLEKEDLLFAIEQLPVHHKTVFNLYVFDDFSHKEIAETLQISAGTSKSHLARARKKIQEILLKKALEMKEKDKKAAILAFFTQDNFYIDDLFRRKIEVNSPVPRPSADLEKLLQNTHNGPKMISYTKVFSIFTIIVAVLGIGFYKMTSTEKTLVNSNQSNALPIVVPTEKDTFSLVNTQKESIDTSKKGIVKVDETSKSAKKRIFISENKNFDVEENTEKQTFVVKKQVVKKDTLFK